MAMNSAFGNALGGASSNVFGEQSASNAAPIAGIGNEIRATSLPTGAPSGPAPYVPDPNNPYSFLGPINYNDLKFGLDGFQTTDLGGGRLSVLGPDGKPIGTAYKGLDESLADLAFERMARYVSPEEAAKMAAANTAASPLSNFKKFGKKTPPPPQEGYWTYTEEPEKKRMRGMGSRDRLQPAQAPTPAPRFKTREEAFAALSKERGNPLSLDSREKYGRSISDLQRWEELGQFLTDKNKRDIKDWTYHRNLGGNNRAETISGANTLYGSKPVIYNNKLLGYELDMTPLNPGPEQMYISPVAQGFGDNKGNTRSSTYMWRDYAKDGWDDIGSAIGDTGNIFVPVDKADKIPGWTNRDTSSYSHKSSGFIPQLASKISGPLNAIAMFVPPLRPVALAVNAVDTIANDKDPLGLITQALGTKLPGMEASFLDKVGGQLAGSIGSSLPSDMASFAPDIASGLIGGGVSVANGGDFLTGALGGGLGSYVGRDLLPGMVGADMMKGKSGDILRGLARSGTNAAVKRALAPRNKRPQPAVRRS